MGKTGILEKIEKWGGLPPLEKILDISSGEGGKQLDSVLGKIEKLSRDAQGIMKAVELLELIERMDDKGTFARVTELLQELKPLTRGKTAALLLKNLEKVDRVIGEIAKEE